MVEFLQKAKLIDISKEYLDELKGIPENIPKVAPVSRINSGCITVANLSSPMVGTIEFKLAQVGARNDYGDFISRDQVKSAFNDVTFPMRASTLIDLVDYVREEDSSWDPEVLSYGVRDRSAN